LYLPPAFTHLPTTAPLVHCCLVAATFGSAPAFSLPLTLDFPFRWWFVTAHAAPAAHRRRYPNLAFAAASYATPAHRCTTHWLHTTHRTAPFSTTTRHLHHTPSSAPHPTPHTCMPSYHTYPAPATPPPHHFAQAFCLPPLLCPTPRLHLPQDTFHGHFCILCRFLLPLNRDARRTRRAGGRLQRIIRGSTGIFSGQALRCTRPVGTALIFVTTSVRGRTAVSRVPFGVSSCVRCAFKIHLYQRRGRWRSPATYALSLPTVAPPTAAAFLLPPSIHSPGAPSILWTSCYIAVFGMASVLAARDLCARAPA